MYPKVNLVCKECGYTARRPLADQAGCRGHHETESIPALCPNGHGYLARKDGFKQYNGRDRLVLLWRARSV